MPYKVSLSPSISPAYTGRLSTTSVPALRLPDEDMEPAAAYRFIHDELMLDGNSRLNLATFVTTWMDPEADKLLSANETDPEISLSIEKRKPVLQQFYTLWTDAVPVIPLFSNTRVYVVRAGLQNFKAGPTQYAADAWNSWEWVLEK